MKPLRVAYIDTETTGFQASVDRIIEIAIVLAEVDWQRGKILGLLDQYQHLQDPGRPIPARAIQVHGIQDAMVKGQRIDTRKSRTMLKAADLLVAHNTRFDKGFVAQVVPEVQDWAWGCSCSGIPWKQWFPALGTTKLQDLSSYFGLSGGKAHRAMGDVETMIKLVSLPGLQGRRCLQHYLLQRTIHREGYEPNLVCSLDPNFCQTYW